MDGFMHAAVPERKSVGGGGRREDGEKREGRKSCRESIAASWYGL